MQSSSLLNGQDLFVYYKVCSVFAKTSSIISTFFTRKSQVSLVIEVTLLLLVMGIDQKSWEQTSFITRWNLATAGSPATQLSFGTATGSGGTTNVFDATVSNSPSVFGFSESAFTGVCKPGWAGVTNITNTLSPNQALHTLCRGTRDQSNILTRSSVGNFTFSGSNKSASAPSGILLKTSL